MGQLVNFVTALHTSTHRDYIERMVDDKVNCMLKAKEYEADYWDGDRRYGYGGYHYMPGRWKAVAEQLINKYNLNNNASILDVGCGKAYLLYELKLILPEINIVGFDISKHALSHAKEEIRDNLIEQRAQDKYPWADNSFDLVISLGCLHNLEVFDIQKALYEIERVGKAKYVMLESYRNEQELFNLQCWALTCESFFSQKEWIWLYEHFGYSGDYEFIYFE
jgi:ubiquinone/menaquinone biosynthesis C-methylase UbiE